MCTSISFSTKHHYFGRTLDLEYHYDERVVITPRNFPLHFRKIPPLTSHFAIIGMAYVQNNYPLYYDATNEKGLSIAGLNFPEHASYHPAKKNQNNITPFEFIPWILGQCKNVDEATSLLENTNLLNEPFCEELPLTPLHWMISDSSTTIVVEPRQNGIQIYENPHGVLTNLPPFPQQVATYYEDSMKNRCIPGGWSSEARFARAAFVRKNSVCGTSESESISQFFHILSSVEVPKGCVYTKDYLCKYTIYSSCCNTETGTYYYKTYDQMHLSKVELFQEDLERSDLIIH